MALTIKLPKPEVFRDIQLDMLRVRSYITFCASSLDW